MSIEGIRYRTEGPLVVLQVAVRADRDFHYDQRAMTWRDALVTDLLDVAEYGLRDGLSDRLTALEWKMANEGATP